MQSQFLKNFVIVGVVISMTLTFYHPLMWLLVAMFAGLTTLLIVPSILNSHRYEPPSFLFAFVWISITTLLAIAYGASEAFYNLPHVAFLVIGVLIGYLISVTQTPDWAAWLPFTVFAIFFSAMIAIGLDPSEALVRNSRNFVSVILLALYASAVLFSKRKKVQPTHLLMSLWTLVIAIWSSGRGGILSALLLNVGLFTNVLLRGRVGILRAISIVLVVMGVATGVYVGWDVMQSQGYFRRLAENGLQDAPRLAMIASYFSDIQPWELLLGKNYYDNSYLARFEFNLHNSYLSAWAHLGLAYLLLILAALLVATKNLRHYPAIAIPLLACALRALTDTQVIAAKYDYIFLGALFVLLRSAQAESQTRPTPVPSPALSYRKFL